MREVRRVLRGDGTLWLNLGSSYAGSWGNQGRKEGRGTQRPINGPMITPVHDGRYPDRESNTGLTPRGYKPKDLIQIPHLVSEALREDGWYLRAAIPWIKPSPMPESTEDRPGTSHEYVFLLTKRERYFYDGYAVKRPLAPESQTYFDRYPGGAGDGLTARGEARYRGTGYRPHSKDRTGGRATVAASMDPAGRNRRTGDWCLEAVAERVAELEAEILQRQADLAELEAWLKKGGLLHDAAGLPAALRVATTPFPGSHFATFPPKLVKPMILAGSSERGCCAKCGGPWVREVERETSPNRAPSGWRETERWSGRNTRGIGEGCTSSTLGWSPSCACAAPVVPCTILDPFAGAGTVPLVATALGRHGLGCDLSAEYLRMARHRIERPHARPARATPDGDHHPLFDREDA